MEFPPRGSQSPKSEADLSAVAVRCTDLALLAANKLTTNNREAGEAVTNPEAVEALSSLPNKATNSASCRWADNISESNKLELELQCLPAPVNLLTGKPIFKRYTHLKHWNDNSLLLLYQAYDNHCHARGRTCPSRDRPSSGNYLSVMRQVLLSRQYAIQSIVS